MSSIKDITLKGTLGNLIPKTQADLLHYALGYIIFRTSIDLGLHAGIALLITIAVACFKELNDKWGWVKFLLSDGKTKTGVSRQDIIKTILIPVTLTILTYINIITWL